MNARPRLGLRPRMHRRLRPPSFRTACLDSIGSTTVNRTQIVIQAHVIQTLQANWNVSLHSSHVAVTVKLATTFKAIRLISATSVYRTATRDLMEAQLVTVHARLMLLPIRALKAMTRPRLRPRLLPMSSL